MGRRGIYRGRFLFLFRVILSRYCKVMNRNVGIGRVNLTKFSLFIWRQVTVCQLGKEVIKLLTIYDVNLGLAHWRKTRNGTYTTNWIIRQSIFNIWYEVVRAHGMPHQPISLSYIENLDTYPDNKNYGKGILHNNAVSENSRKVPAVYINSRIGRE